MRACLGILSLSLLACGAAPAPRCDAGCTSDAGPTDGGYDVNDVSFLYPLPAANALDDLLGANASGPEGVLLPRALYDGLALKAGAYDALRVLGVRVDPCFPATDAGCLRQVRLVLQPVDAVERTDGGIGLPGQSTTQDHAVHLFYDLDAPRWQRVLDAVAELHDLAQGRTRGVPLGVHPVLAAEGLQGPYTQRLRSLVLQVCGERTFSRLATTTLTPPDRWVFRAFDLKNGALVPDPIPRTPMLASQAFTEFGTAPKREGELAPAPVGDDMTELLSSNGLVFLDDFTLNAALESALHVEHPDQSSPRTIDCGSCHVASRARENAEAVRMKTTVGHPGRFTAPGFSLARTDEAANDPRAMRAFGYFGRRTALSQRTINESAHVARALSR